ncbi:MAG: diacylglycerol/lipid kinase family protein [Flavobacteriales bacterium]
MKAIQYDWFVVVNPNANSGKAMKQWSEFSMGLERNKICYYAAITNHIDESNQKVKQAIEEGYRHFAVFGGDGTLHHFLNAIMQEDESKRKAITIGILPVGTGNDFLKSIKLSSNHDNAVQRLKTGKSVATDIGEVKYADGQKRYFLNMAGVGFDALVARDVNLSKAKGKGGLGIYLKYLLKHLFRYRSVNIHLKTTGFEKKDTYLSILCGNGGYAGGGMELVPGAQPQDGLLHITLIKKINPWKVLLNIQKLYTGNILKIRESSQVITKEIRLESNEQVPIQLDGEEAGFLPVEIKIKPLAIHILSD